MFKNQTYLPLLLILCFSIAGYAQEYNFKTYGLPEGLSQAQIADICEDSQGYLWFATNGGGISKFDGVNFTTISTEDGLPSNYARCLTSDSLCMYVGTGRGLAVFGATGSVKSYGIEDGLENEIINDLVIHNGTLWIATNHGVFTFKGEKFKQYLVAPEGASQNVSSLNLSPDGHILAGLNETGMAILNSNTSELLSYFDKRSGLANTEVRSLLVASNNIFVGTYGGGVFRLAGGKVSHIPNTSTLIINHLSLHDDHIWLATQKNGILIFQKDSFAFVNALSAETGLPGNFITTVFTDSWNNTWLGTSGLGAVKKYADNISHYRELSGMGSTVIRDLEIGPDSQILFSTNEGGLYELNKHKAEAIEIPRRLDEAVIRCFLKDADGRIWLGTDGMGLYEETDGKWRRYTSRKGIAYGWIKDIIQDQYGKIWVASTGGGVYYLDEKRFRSINSQDSIKVERAECLLEDSRGSIWAGSRGKGLLKISAYHLDTIYAEMANTNIRCLAEDADGNIYMGTDQGLLLLNVTTEKPQFFGRNNGLYSTNIYSLSRNANLLYVGHDHGVDVFDISSKKVVENYHFRNGFTGGECSQNAMKTDAFGNTWIGTLRGISRIQSSDQPARDASHTLAIQPEPYCFNALMDEDFLASYESDNGGIIFPHTQHSFSFTMKGVNQRFPDLVEYRWKLEGHEDSFSRASTNETVNYAQLLPGSYQFVYQAGVQGSWSPQVKGFEFTIMAPIWKRTWFRSFIIVVIILLIGGLIYARINSIKRKAKRREAQLELEKNLVTLQSKALQLQMNPHFIFNALNSVKGLIAVKDEKSAKLYLARFAKLMRLMLENSREEWVSIESEMELIELYLNLETIAQEHTFEFNIEVDKDIDEGAEKIPPMVIQPFVENAVKHAMRYKKGDGIIDIKLQHTEERVICTILDNGPGREAVKKLQVEPGHNSLAMTITAERMAQKGYNAREAVIIEDVLNNGKVMGTRVELKIPMA